MKIVHYSVLIAVVLVHGCGLAGSVDDGDPSIKTYVDIEMASAEVFDVPQTQVWAYHDVPPKRWGVHSDLTLDMTLAGAQRELAMIVNLPAGFGNVRDVRARWSMTPTAFYPWIRISDTTASQILVAESGELDSAVTLEKDGEYVRINGTDLVMTDTCGNAMTVNSFTGAFRVGRDDLLNQFTPEQLDEVETIAQGSGQGCTIRIDGQQQSDGGGNSLDFEHLGGADVVAYLASFVDACGTKLEGVFSNLPLKPSSSTVQSATRIFVTYDDPSSADGFDVWCTDDVVAYDVDHWPSGPGDYGAFELVGPVNLYRADLSTGALVIDYDQSRTLGSLTLVGDLGRDCRPKACN